MRLVFSSLNRNVISIEPRKNSDVYMAVLFVDAESARNAAMQKIRYTKEFPPKSATAAKMGLSQGYLSDLENAGRGWTEQRVKQFKAAVDLLATQSTQRTL